MRAIVISFVFGVLVSSVAALPLLAAAPSGDDYFQLLTNVTTGGDNTGDGGTGNPADLNYYYVGQSFTTTMQIVSAGALSANIWIDYDTATTTASNLTTGSFFDTWSGQTINTSEPTSFGGSRILSTGLNFINPVNSVGTGSFGTVRFTANEPTAAAYGTGSPGLLDINIGTIGDTTESNISVSSIDVLDDAEDFQFHIWADTVPPFADSISPTDGATGIPVTSNVTFNLRDTLNGQGDLNGVGTGVNTSEPPGIITLNGVDETDDSSFSCSGIWGSNLCAVTVNPDPPSGQAGDPRNFEYNTTYTLVVSGFEDFASTDQDSLGDANGPNAMVATTTTFTTEGDAVAPQVTSRSPGAGSAGNAVSTDISVTVEDRISYPSGASGIGLVTSSCSIDVGSPSVATTTYTYISPDVTVASTTYGVQFTINPTIDFSENETVTVIVRDCVDRQGNVMVTDTYTFGTTDGSRPYVDELDPADDAFVAASGTISFHIKDDGVGVNLNETVVYVNGTYYTNGGGAGQVTTTGTRITYTSSLDFTGGNYAGDTTALTGTANDYSFVIDPQNDFVAGESIPILIYTEDVNGNVMEREVVGVVAAVNGASFCGATTTWNGTACVAVIDGSTFCGASSTWNGTSCEGVATAGSAFCGASTTWDGVSCISAISGDGFCGTNTSWNGTTCVSTITSTGRSGGGGSNLLGSITFAGVASPYATVYIREEGLIIATAEADASAVFEIEVDDLKKGEYNLSLFAEDTDGRLSSSLAYQFMLEQRADGRITDIYLPPTMDVGPVITQQGGLVTVTGRSVPDSTITVGINADQEQFQFTDVDESGAYNFTIDTSRYEVEEYQVRVRSATAEAFSAFSKQRTFVVEESLIIVNEGFATCVGDECLTEYIFVPQTATVTVTERTDPAPFTVLLRNYIEIFNGDYYLEFIELGDVPIERYEVVELPKTAIPESLNGWTEAVSPYRLADQALESVVYVRGFTADGEVYVVQLDLSLFEDSGAAWYDPASGTTAIYYLRYIPFDLLLVLLLCYLVLRSYQRHKEKNQHEKTNNH
ncbi:MAG: Ig-like domain-containing protein [Patescibacteria group bacterium]